MVDYLQVADTIQKCIQELDDLKKDLDSVGRKKSELIALYEKQLAKTIICLRTDKEYWWEGEKICNPPVSIIEKVARGMLWKQKLEMDTAESMYKNHIEKIRITESQLNGWQSINRYLQEVAIKEVS